MKESSIIAEGKTTNEAIENGLKVLKVSKEKVNIKVIEEEKRSFFSILAPRVVKVELTLKEEDDKTEEQKSIKREKKPATKENIEQAEKNLIVFLDDIIEKIGQGLDYSIMHDEYGLIVQIKGEKSSMFIGHRGETMYAFQTIVSAVANRGISNKVRVVINIENYKEKREKTLQELAKKVAKSVERTRRTVTLEPMQAYERKIIHSALQDSKTVKTVSIGEEPRRRVVISLK